MTTPAEAFKTPPGKRFIWVTQDGERLAPSQMRTSHLFYSLRMIWNHTMPEDARIRPYKEYQADWPRYDIAIRHLAAELATRDDLEPYLEAQFQFMLSYLKTKLKADMPALNR